MDALDLILRHDYSIMGALLWSFLAALILGALVFALWIGNAVRLGRQGAKLSSFENVVFGLCWLGLVEPYNLAHLNLLSDTAQYVFVALFAFSASLGVIVVVARWRRAQTPRDYSLAITNALAFGVMLILSVTLVGWQPVV
jgi:hypothetical protein